MSAREVLISHAPGLILPSASAPTTSVFLATEAAEIARLFHVDARRGRQYQGGDDSPDIVTAIPGTHFLNVKEAKVAFKKGEKLASIYGSMTIGNKFNMDNKVYKVSQKPDSYLVPGVVTGMK